MSGNCNLSVESYFTVVEKLLKADFQRFKLYKNVVEFIQQRGDLSNERKVNALFNTAYIYKTLSKQEKQIDAKDADSVLQFQYLGGNPTEFLKAVYKKFDLYFVKPPDFQDVKNAISNLEQSSILVEGDITPILKTISNIILTSEFINSQQRYDYASDAHEYIKTFLNSRKDVNKDALIKVVDKSLEKYIPSTAYISIQDSRLNSANLNTKIVHLENGQAVEVFQEEGSTVLYEVFPDGKVDTKPFTKRIAHKPVNAINISTAFDIRHVVFTSDLSSLMRFKPLSGLQTGEWVKMEDFVKIFEQYNLDPLTLREKVKIRLRAVSDLSDVRLERIKEAASKNEELAGLLNRNHETFENVNQIKYLLENPEGEIVTTSRPKANDVPFNLIGEITTPTGQKVEFIFYPYTNYAFVKGDNTTEIVDFSNPDHQVRFAKASTVKMSKTQSGYVRPLSKGDFQKFQYAVDTYKQFQNNVLAEYGDVIDNLNENPNIDVTDLFFETYDFARNWSYEKVRFSEPYNTDSRFTEKVKVINNEGEIQDRLIGYSFKLIKSRTNRNDLSNATVFPLNIYLKDGEKILIGDAQLSYENYVFEKFGLTPDINDAVPHDEFVNKVLGHENPEKGKLRVDTFVLKTDPTKGFTSNTQESKHLTYHTLSPLRSMERSQSLVRMVTSFYDLLSYRPETAEEAQNLLPKMARSFGKNEFAFNTAFGGFRIDLDYKQIKDNAILESTKGFFTIKLSPNSSAPSEIQQLFSSFDLGRRLFTKDLTQNYEVGAVTDNFVASIAKAYKSLGQDSKLIPKIKQQLPDVYNQFDVSTSQGMNDFYTTLAERHRVNQLTATEVELLQLINDYLPELLGNAINRHIAEFIVGTKDETSPVGYLSKNLKTLKTKYPSQAEELDRVYNTFINYLKTIPQFVDSKGDLKTASIFTRTRIHNSEAQIEPNIEDKRINRAEEKDPRFYNVDITDTASLSIVPASTVTKILIQESDKNKTVVNEETVVKPTAPVVEEQNVVEEKPVTKPVIKTRRVFSAVNDTEFFETENNDERLNTIKWFAQTYRMFGIDTNSLPELIESMKVNGAVLGMFKDDVVYLNNTLKQKGVVYHEAFHAVFRRLLTDSERKEILNTVINDPAYADRFTSEKIEKFLSDRNMTEPTMEAIKLMAEEIIADKFRDHMLYKHKPQSFLQKLFTLLKGLIKLFKKNNDVIEDYFKKIGSGYYASRDLNSSFSNHQAAFELIPVIPKISKEGEQLFFEKNNTLTVTQQNELISRVAHHILTDKDGKNPNAFDRLFEKITQQLIKDYNVERIINDNKVPETSEKANLIRAKYKTLYRNYRFVLGEGKTEGYTLEAIPTFETDKTYEVDENYVVNENNEEVDNKRGDYSLSILKKQVRKFYNKQQALVAGSYDLNPESTDLIELSEAYINDDSDVTPASLNSDINEELDTNEFTDEALGETNRLTSLPSVIRLFFASVNSKEYDEDLHIYVNKMIDGNRMFAMMMARVSTLPIDQILPSIKSHIYELAEDGYMQESRNLKAVYDTFVAYTGLDENTFQPKTNHGLYYALLNTLSGTELAYIHLTIEKKDADNKAAVSRYTVKDFVVSQDLEQKKNSIIESIQNKHYEAHVKGKNTQEYLKALDNVFNSRHYFIKKGKLNPSSQVSKLLDEIIFEGKKDYRLNFVAEQLYDSFKTIGITLPKTFIKLSLYNSAYNYYNKNDILRDTLSKYNADNPSVVVSYKANINIVALNKILNYEFFNAMEFLITPLKDSNKELLANIFDREYSKTDDISTKLNKFEASLREFSEYIIKTDPSNLPSVIRNAEQKLVYRYAKWFPIKLMTQHLRENGALSFIREDEHYDKHLKTFYKNNPVLSLFYKEENNEPLTPEEQIELTKHKEFFKTFDTSLFGGASERILNEYMPGSNFIDIDSKSLYLLNLVLFANREYVTSIADDGTEITNEQFLRSFSILEASQTNFLMPSLYQSFYNDRGDVTVNINGKQHLKITNTLFNLVKQEYARILDNESKFDSRLKKYKSKKKFENDFVLKYNAGKDQDGNPIKQGRAYDFNYLSTFWKNPSNEVQTIKNKLLSLARNKVPFEQVDSSDVDMLLNLLDEHAEFTFDQHLEQLERIDLIKKQQTPIFTLSQAGKERYNKEKKNNIETDFSTYDLETDFEPAIVNGEQLTVDAYKSQSLDAIKIKKPNFTSNPVLNEYGAYSMSPEVQYAISKNPMLFTKGNAEPIPLSTGNKVNVKDIRGFLKDSYFNTWHASLVYNQMFDGDRALTVKDAVDYFKRNKKHLASGPNMPWGFHRTAIIDSIREFVDPVYAEYGPYTSEYQIQNDIKLAHRPDIKLKILTNFKEASLNDYKETFDGQSYSSLLHQIDQYEAQGRLDDKSLKLLIKKHYKKLTKEETDYLYKRKIVNNPKKTVYAGRTVYHKQSEHYIDRNDVSELIIPEGMTYEQVEDILHNIYTEIYGLRQQNKMLYDQGNPTNIESNFEKIKSLIQEAHKFYVPLPHRVMLYNLLNSMEYHQIDQLMDPSASKNATMLPVSLNDIDTTFGYINLYKSQLDLTNKYKFIQVETSGIKDIGKVSVQNKILVAADLNRSLLENLTKKINNTDSLTEQEYEEIENVVRLKEIYLESLKDVVESNLNYLMKVIRKGGDFQIGRVYDIIRDSLIEQNAPTSEIQKFATQRDENGVIKPILSPNLPDLRNKLEYYFFSEYSRYATDERASGFKSIHVSQWGYNVLQDENGNVIPTQEFTKNKDFYATRNITSRPLSVTYEEETNTYWAEIIVPLPYLGREERKFYMDNLRKGFATRIPTEDKRSMIAFKIVDFVDSSQLNAVIVPQFVHILAGSDFDVDALYGQTFNYYKGLDGKFHLYGKYNNYSSSIRDLGPYLEFIHYTSQNHNFKTFIEEEEALIKTQQSFSITDRNIEKLMSALRTGKKYEYSEFQSKTIDDLQKFIENSKENLNELEEYEKYREDIESNIEYKNFQISELELAINEAAENNPEDVEDLLDDLEDAKAERDSLLLNYEADNERGKLLKQSRTFYNYYESAIRFQAIINVLKKYDIPYDYENFEKGNFSKFVTPIHQNRNLAHKLNILSNPLVFQSLYIRERSSLDSIKKILKNSFGIDPKDLGSNYDPDTIDGIIKTKEINNQGKDGIGQTAVTNKMLGLLSQYELRLSENQVVWKFVDESLTKKVYDSFADLSEPNVGSLDSNASESERVIAIIGNILGMFADNAKEPLPFLLKLNEVNTNATLLMLALRMPPNMVFALNYIKEVIDATQEVKNSIQTIQTNASEDGEQEQISFSEALTNQMLKLVKENPTVISSLKEKKLIEGTTVFDLKIKKDLLFLNYEPIKFGSNKNTKQKFENNTLTSRDIGFKLQALQESLDKNSDPKSLPLTVEEQTLILLSLYRDTVYLSNRVSKVATVSNLFKKLDPRFSSFDRIRDAFNDLYENANPLDEDQQMLFTPFSIQKMFAPDQVFTIYRDMLEDMNIQAGKLFLERDAAFKFLPTLFGNYFTEDSTKLTNTFNRSVIMYLIKHALERRRKRLYEPYKEEEPDFYESVMTDTLLLKKMFDPKYWYYNTLKDDVRNSRDLDPENRLLQGLTPSKNNTQKSRHLLVDEATGKTYTSYFNYIYMSNRNHLTPELSEEVSDAFEQLYNENRPLARELFYQELLRTGVGADKTTYLKYAPANMWKEISDILNEFILAFSHYENLEQSLIDILGDEIYQDAEVIEENKAIKEKPRVLAIIGSAGRGTTPTLEDWENMLKDAEQKVKPTDILISGGAAFADHVAVRLFLDGKVAGLKLRLPVPFKDKFEEAGPEIKSSGSVANGYHRKFSSIIGRDTLSEIQQAINKGAEVTYEPIAKDNNFSNFFARNSKVAREADEMIAYTYGKGKEPEDGGTADTWKKFSKKKTHVSIRNMIPDASELDEKLNEPITTKQTNLFTTVKNYKTLKAIKDLNVYTNNGLDVNVLRSATGEEHNFGNPFIGSIRQKRNDVVDNITVFNTIDEAREAYKNWLLDKIEWPGTSELSKEEGKAKREWIIKQIKEGKLNGVNLLYYKPASVVQMNGTKITNYKSHADVLAEIVNNNELNRLSTSSVKTKSTIDKAFQYVMEKIAILAAEDPKLPARKTYVHINKSNFVQTIKEAIKEYKIENNDTFIKSYAQAILNKGESLITFNPQNVYVENLEKLPLEKQTLVKEKFLKRYGIEMKVDSQNQTFYTAPLIMKFDNEVYMIQNTDGIDMTQEIVSTILSGMPLTILSSNGNIKFTDFVHYTKLNKAPAELKNINTLMLDSENIEEHLKLSSTSAKVSLQERKDFRNNTYVYKPENESDNQSPYTCNS